MRVAVVVCGLLAAGLVVAEPVPHPCTIQVTPTQIMIDGSVASSAAAVAMCHDGARVTGTLATSPLWLAYRDALTTAHIPVTVPQPPIYVEASALVAGSVAGTKDVVGAATLRISGQGWWFGVEQPFASFSGRRLASPSGFRDMRLGLGGHGRQGSAGGSIGAWFTVPTASELIVRSEVGISAEASGMRELGSVHAGLAARAGRHDDWLLMDIFDATYFDLSPAAAWSPTGDITVQGSCGLTQLYEQAHLAVHAEVEGSFGHRVAVRLGYIYDDRSIWMLSVQADVGASVRGSWRQANR